MPNTKKSDQRTTTGQNNISNKRNQASNPKGRGMQPGAMPHIPTARERAKEIDSDRRSNAQTFEL